MSPTTHYLLKHSCEIDRQLPLSVAYFAEDANEAWHKMFRQNMITHARQNSRSTWILDVFHRAEYLSDPLISLILIKKGMMSHEERDISPDIKEFIEER